MVYCAGALSSGFCALSFVVVGEYGWCAGEILDIEQVAFGSGMPPVMAWPDGRLVTQDADGAFQVVGTCPKAADFEERQELLEYERAVMREVIGAGRNGTWAEDGQKEDAYFPHGARVLVVGDGDLSWSCSLIRGRHVCASNLTCTVLEKSEKEFLEKYRSEEVRDNMDILIGSDAKVLFNTDATSTQMDLYARCRTQLFNVIVWNFPYVKTCNAEARLCSGTSVSVFPVTNSSGPRVERLE